MKDLRKRRYMVVALTALESGATEYYDFAFKVKSHMKTLTGITLFAPELANTATAEWNVELGMWANNRKTPIGNLKFAIGYHSFDDKHCRMIDVNQPIQTNNEITGFIKYLDGAHEMNVKLYLEFEIE